MRVLVACEFSGVVRTAFEYAGWDAYSCDLLPTERNYRTANHFRGDVLTYLDARPWDLMIAHPPCTRLCVSGARWKYDPRFPNWKKEQDEAAEFFMKLVNAPIHRICVENPVSIMSSLYRKPDQIIHPWQFGHDASKATCLWLKNLPKLKPTLSLGGDRHTRRANQTASGQNKLGPSPDRGQERSITYQGFADAMASQWSGLMDFK